MDDLARQQDFCTILAVASSFTCCASRRGVKALQQHVQNETVAHEIQKRREKTLKIEIKNDDRGETVSGRTALNKTLRVTPASSPERAFARLRVLLLLQLFIYLSTAEHGVYSKGQPK